MSQLRRHGGHSAHGNARNHVVAPSLRNAPRRPIPRRVMIGQGQSKRERVALDASPIVKPFAFTPYHAMSRPKLLTACYSLVLDLLMGFPTCFPVLTVWWLRRRAVLPRQIVGRLTGPQEGQGRCRPGVFQSSARKGGERGRERPARLKVDGNGRDR